MRVSFAHFLVLVMVMFEAPLLAQWSAPQQVALDPEFDGYTMLTPHVLHTLRKDNVLFVTISASRGCHFAKVVAPPLREYMESVGVPIYLVDTSSHAFVKEVTQPTGSVPLILVFKGERLIDGQLGFGSGADEGFFGAMVRRLGLPPSEHGLDYPSPAPFRFRDNWKRYSKGVLRSGRSITFAEVDLRGADLSDVEFTNAVITHSNFEGAKLDEAKCKRTTWINTVCPDGSNSDSHGYRCVGY